MSFLIYSMLRYYINSSALNFIKLPLLELLLTNSSLFHVSALWRRALCHKLFMSYWCSDRNQSVAGLLNNFAYLNHINHWVKIPVCWFLFFPKESELCPPLITLSLVWLVTECTLSVWNCGNRSMKKITDCRFTVRLLYVWKGHAADCSVWFVTV